MAGYCCFDPQSVWYRVSQKKLGSSVYANISSLSSHFEITKDSFKIYRISAFQSCLNFDPVKVEIFEVKGTRGHIQNEHFM